MGTERGLLEALRSRLAEMQQRQQRSGGTADPGFWQSVVNAPSAIRGGTAPRAKDAATGETNDAATGETNDAATGETNDAAAGETKDQATGGARKPRKRGPRVAPEARTPWRGTGPWSQIPTEQLAEVDPLQTRWLSDEQMDDPAWIDATAERAARYAQQGRPDGDAGSEPVPVMLDAVCGMPLVRHHEDELARAGQWLAHRRASDDVMLVNVIAELEARGVPAPDGLSRTDWLRAHDPGLTAAQARAFVTVGAAFTAPCWAGLRTQVVTQQVTVTNAAQIIVFQQKVAPVADPDDLHTALTDMVGQAGVLREEELRTLIRHHTEQIRPPRDDEATDAGRRQARGLSFGPPNATGMVAMKGTLDPEAAAIIKSAIDPLSIPCPDKDEHGHTTAPDPRTPAKRRADALLEIIGRGVSAPDGIRKTDKTKIIVTIDWDTLIGLLRGTGVTTSGDVLSASTVRRMACDAGIIPMVLGTQGEPLDVGRLKRLVTGGLRLALIARDKGCSFPGCTMPPHWTDAHHERPWYLGGKTSLLTCALLCEKHHTHVHRNDLHATITATTVTWHL